MAIISGLQALPRDEIGPGERQQQELHSSFRLPPLHSSRGCCNDASRQPRAAVKSRWGEDQQRECQSRQ